MSKTRRYTRRHLNKLRAEHREKQADRINRAKMARTKQSSTKAAV